MAQLTDEDVKTLRVYSFAKGFFWGAVTIMCIVLIHSAIMAIH